MFLAFYRVLLFIFLALYGEASWVPALEAESGLWAQRKKENRETSHLEDGFELIEITSIESRFIIQLHRTTVEH